MPFVVASSKAKLQASLLHGQHLSVSSFSLGGGGGGGSGDDAVAAVVVTVSGGRRRRPQLHAADGGGGSYTARPPLLRRPLASLSLASHLTRTWSRLDADRKGHVTEADLQAYAAERGLPEAYVQPFLRAALAHEQQQQQHHQPQQHQQLQQQQLDDDDDGRQQQPADVQLSYDAFAGFVRSREAALRRAFGAFDVDGDGRIALEDVDASLSRVVVCCPTGGCSMRVRRAVACQLLQRLAAAGDGGGGGGGSCGGAAQLCGSGGDGGDAGGCRSTSTSSSTAATSSGSTTATTSGSSGGGSNSVTFARFREFFLLLPDEEALAEYWLTSSAAAACCAETATGHFSVVDRRRRRGSPWGHLLAGAVAGAASRTATAPLETLRLAAMTGTVRGSLLDVARQIYAAGGWRALYRGNVVNMLRSGPARALDFASFELLRGDGGDSSYLRTFGAAGLAGSLSWALLYPLEVVRSRLTLGATGTAVAAAAAAAASTPTTSMTAAATTAAAAAARGGVSGGGIADCFRGILAREGPRALWRGLCPSLLAIAPEAALTYGLHDLLMRWQRERARREPSVAESLLAGVAAAWCGTLASFPLETVSRRLQLGAAAAGGGGGAAAAAGAASGGAVAAAGAGGGGCAVAAGTSSSWVDVLRALLREGGGGPGALYRGLGAATLRLLPSAAVSWGCYELVRRAVLEAEARAEARAAAAEHAQLWSVLLSAQQQQKQQQQQQGVGEAGAAACGGAGGSGCLPVEPLRVPPPSAPAALAPCAAVPSGVRGCPTTPTPPGGSQKVRE